MARKARIPTPAEIQAIRDLKAKGQSDTKIAQALSCSRNTLIKWKKMAEAANEDGETIGEQIEHAIKKGREERRERHLDLAIDSLDYLISGGYREEVSVKRERIKDGTDEEGNQKYKLVVTEEKTNKRWYQPNPTLVMFTLVNKDPDNWQSINKAADTKGTEVMPEGASIEVVDEGEIEE